MPGKKDLLPIMPEGTDPATLLKAWGTGKTYQEIADLLCISIETYKKWALGTANIPHQRLPDIVRVFRLNEAQTTQLYEAMQRVAPRKNNLPLKNLFFTGRESYMKCLDQCFKEDNYVAISGLGGIGKTQLALEYAHRQYKKKIYRAVLWMNAADQRTIESSYHALAEELDLLERDEREVERIRRAVKRWFTEHTHWLLVMDNADDLSLARSFFPAEGQGHILLTTRSQIGGAAIARQIELAEMTPEEGLSFLLTRSKKLQSDADTQEAAQQLVELLGRHPLALDQAGAYIEGNPTRTFAEYIDLYYTQRRRLLDRLERPTGDHPESVLVTFELCFQKARELNPLAQDILHFCAFLHPDSIPEKLFQHDDSFKDTIAFDEGIRALRSYSLIKPNAQKKTFSMHRLVQAVLQDTLEQLEKHLWILRAVQAVNASFPDPEFGGTWPQREWPECERLVPHGVQIAPFTETEQIVNTEAGTLLHKTALYLWNRRDFIEVERLYQQALHVRRQLFGSSHPDVAASLNGLANLYYEQSRYTEAESLYRQALRMRECLLGPEHPDLVSSLNGLAKLYYYAKANYTEAEVLYLRAICIAEKHVGQAHPYMAYLLMNLANLYADQGTYDQAEPRYKRAIRIWEQLLGPKHPSTALACNNLGALYLRKHDYVQAEACFLKARQIWEELQGSAHPYVATALNNLGDACREQHKYTEAEPLYQRALQILEERFGPGSTDLAYPLTGLADTYRQQGRFADALHHYKRALRLRKKAFGLQHPGTADTLDGLGQLREAQGKYEQARILYAHVRTVREQVFGLSHSSTVEIYQRFIALLHRMGKHSEAAQLEATLQTAHNMREVEKGSR